MVLTKQQLVTRLGGIGSDLSAGKLTIAAAEVEFVQSLQNTQYAYFSMHFESSTKSVASFVRFVYTVILTIDNLMVGSKFKRRGQYMFETELPKE